MPTANPLPALQIQRLLVTVDGQQETRLCALAEGQFIGTCAFKASKHTASLIQLFVAHQYRHRGVGSILVRECEHLAQRYQIPGLGLLISQTNEAVKPFYDRLGFVPIFQYADGDLLMWKSVLQTGE